MSLLALPAVRRAVAAPLLMGDRRYQSISPACPPGPQQQPAARCCSGREMGQTDRRTDRGTRNHVALPYDSTTIKFEKHLRSAKQVERILSPLGSNQ